MKIVNDELTYKSNKKSNGYNVNEGSKILKTDSLEGITSRQGKTISKKKMERMLKSLQEQRVMVLKHSVSAE